MIIVRLFHRFIVVFLAGFFVLLPLVAVAWSSMPAPIQKNGGLGSTIARVYFADLEGNFDYINSCGSITQGASCGIKVAFWPQTIADKTGILTIISNDPARRIKHYSSYGARDMRGFTD
jgi:hypothetical protein